MSDAAVTNHGELFRVIIRPNQSMSARGLAAFVITFAVVSLTIALSFFALGFWLILPFAGLEIAVVALAIGLTVRRSGDFEMIVIDQDSIQITQHRSGQTARHAFNRYWATVKLEHRGRLQSKRLTVGSHGRFVSIGADATDATREDLAARMRHALRAV